MKQYNLPLYESINELADLGMRQRKPGTRPKVSPAERDMVIQLLLVYGSQAKVCELTGLSSSSISRIAIEAEANGRFVEILEQEQPECVRQAWVAIRLGIDRCIEALADKKDKMPAATAAQIISHLSRFIDTQNPDKYAAQGRTIDDMSVDELYRERERLIAQQRPNTTH